MQMNKVERQIPAGTADYQIVISLLFPGKAPLFRDEVLKGHPNLNGEDERVSIYYLILFDLKEKMACKEPHMLPVPQKLCLKTWSI
jgi:hypothetical protein